MPCHKASNEYQILLGLFDTKENRQSVETLLENIHLGKLAEFALENEMHFTITGDGKCLPYFCGTIGSSSNEPCSYCDLKVQKVKKDGRFVLKTDWMTYLKPHGEKSIVNAPKPVLDAMETLGFTNFIQMVTPPSLHCLLSADSFIKHACSPDRMPCTTDKYGIKVSKQTIQLRCKIVDDLIRLVISRNSSGFEEVTFH